MSRTGEMLFFNYSTTAPYLHYGVVDADSGLGGRPYRYNYAATNEPGWFLFNGLVKHDTLTGREERYQFEPGVFCSEVGVAPRVGGTERIASGTHSCWAPLGESG